MEPQAGNGQDSPVFWSAKGNRMNITITLTNEEVKLLENDLLDIQEWIQGAVDGKVNNCWKRFQQEWTTRLMNDPNFTDPIPSNKEDFIALVTSREDYKNRAEAQQEL